VAKWYQEQKRYKGPGPKRSKEFQRVFALPTRIWDKEPEDELLEAQLRCRGGEIELHRHQIVGIREFATVGGGVAFWPVGTGKFLATALAPTVMNCERPAICVPASLRDATWRRLDEAGKHFHIHDNIDVFSYSQISTNRDFLEIQAYDLISFDECHKLALAESGRTKRVFRYAEESKREDERALQIIMLSGTMMKREFTELAPLLELAVGSKNCPLPLDWRELEHWQRAANGECDGGALGDDPTAMIAERIHATEGIISVTGIELPFSLNIYKSEWEASTMVKDAIRNLHKTWTRPDGFELTDIVEVYRVERQLASGFFYKWKSPGPEPWMKARKEYNARLRTVRGCDTPGEADVKLKEWGDKKREAWFDIKGTFEPEQEAVWFDESLMLYVIKNLLKGKFDVFWTSHTAVLDYIHNICSNLVVYGDATDRVDPCVLSIKKNGTGKDLEQFSKPLIDPSFMTGRDMEQLLGRHHRLGQEADEVEATLLQHTNALRQDFKKQKSDVANFSRLTRNTAKLTIATHVGFN